ncbi:M10 family metallopeptidase C-terminal domain-containing protein [Pseudomonas sp. 15FMM2]|uniref:M10 family metallopeptidase C-terminal domain-containing protein n=1 Tax=Pseudomonas imrae TaxID=2992837 RepID=A0ACC7P9C2_9PSED
MTSVTQQGSSTLQDIEKFRHRDDRGGDIQHKGFQSKTTEEAARQLTRGDFVWPDKNRDGKYQISYEFRSAPDNKNEKRDGKTEFSPIMDNQRKQTKRSLQSISDVANIKFSEGPRTEKSEGHITIGNYGKKVDTKGYPYDGATHHAHLPGSTSEGDVWFKETETVKSVSKAAHGSAGRWVITHELGHAMGLNHPGDYNGSGDDRLSKKNVDSHEDSQSHTSMSYRGERNHYMNHGGFRSSAPQLDDITAYQSKYGANHDTRKDDTTYGFNSNTDRDFLSLKKPDDKMVAAIWDGGGKDTLDFSGYKQDQKISLKDGTFSDVGGLKGNVSIAYGAKIENAIGGSGNDLLVGNAANNELRGGDGNDVLYGAEGRDKLWGGKGNDTFVYGAMKESTYKAPDHIKDFNSGKDKVDLSGVTAELGSGPLKYVNQFSGASGEAVLRQMPTGVPGEVQSTLEISGKPGQPGFLLVVDGKLLPRDIVS